MVTVNKYVTQNASSKAVDVDKSARSVGAKVKKLPFSFEKGAETNGSIWRVGRISPFAILIGVKIANDTISSLTELDIGFYKPLTVGGAVISIDCIKDGLNPGGGQATLTEQYAPAVDDVGKEAYLIAGLTEAEAREYGTLDVVLTGVVAGTDTGSIAGVIEYLDS